MWLIGDRLWLGDYDSGCSALRGAERSTAPDGPVAPFSGVVSLCPMPLLAGDEIHGPERDETEWLHIPIFDGGNGEGEFEAALGIVLPFMRRRLRRGNVLVHCAAGMSRSVSVIAAFLCDHEAASVDQAYERVALAKARAFGEYGYAAELLIAPAWEFQTCLRRLYPREDGRPGGVP